MWSIKHKPVSAITESARTKCRVCKKENHKELITEKRRLTILYVIPITLATERVEVCPDCNARMKVKESRDLIDSKL